MAQLNQMKCEACREGAPHATPEEIDQYKPLIPDWEIVQDDGADTLKRTYHFANFAETMRFVNAVANAAEEEGHHPVMVVEFRAATVRWWSHKINGLHVNDFIMAAKTDMLASAING